MASAKNASQRSSNKKANQNYSTSLAKGGSVSVKNGVKTYSDSPLKVTGKNGISISGESYSRNKGGTGFSPTGAGVITADSIKPNAAVTIPSLVPTKVGDYTANNAGLVGGEFGVTQQGNNLTVPPETATETTGTDKWASYINSFNKSQQDSRDLMSEQPSMADVQRKLERETGIKRIRQDVNNYTGQLNTITANRDANILKLEGQGRGITDVIIGGQQAAVNKEAAIQALPVQAQLAAAQGNLELAQDHINTWGQILMTDATNKYNQKKELINNLRDFTTTIELKKIEEIDKANERKYQENQAFVSAKTAALAWALGQEAPSSVINAIKNATTIEDVVAATGIYNGDLLAREAQRASISASRASSRASNATAAAAWGTLNGKSQTEGERLTEVYATRMNEANAVVEKLGGKFAKPQAVFGSFLSNIGAPSLLLSPERQQYDQAQRNFLNAVLRKESGAVISNEEFSSGAKQYFPQAGDSSGVLQQKTQNRSTAINGLYATANVAPPTVAPAPTGVPLVTKSGLSYTILSNP